MTSETIGGAGDYWAHGYDFAGSGLVCHKCRCLITKKASEVRLHDEWHEQLGG